MGVVSMYTEREKPTLLWVRADGADGSETDSRAVLEPTALASEADPLM